MSVTNLKSICSSERRARSVFERNSGGWLTVSAVDFDYMDG